MEIFPLAVCCLSLTACTTASSSRPAAPESATPAVGEDAARAPLFVHWQLLSDEGGRLRVSAVVVRKATFRVPIDVRVEVPEGLQLVSGQTAFQIAPGLTPGETTSTLEFTYLSAPRTDLKLVAHASGPGMGVQATGVYRFGRAESKATPPQPTGPAVQVGNLNLGPSIPIEAK
jgi:hypothetical protein